MTAKQIDWGLDNNKGVSFYTINKGFNKVLIQEGDLMITLGKMMNQLNNELSAASNRLQDVTKNLNWLNEIDTKGSTFGVLMLIGTLVFGGFMGLSSMALVDPEALEDANLLTKGSNYLNKSAQGMGSPKMQLLLAATEGTLGAGIILSVLQAYCSIMKGLANSEILKLQAYSDGSQQGIKLESSSEDKAAKTTQVIGKAVQQAMEQEYRSKTRELYYNN